MSGEEAREILEKELRRELFGPSEGAEPLGTPLDCSRGTVRFDSDEASRGQFHDASSGEEIITIGTPLTRYGVGVLHGGSSDLVAAHGSVTLAEAADDELAAVPGLAMNDLDPQGQPVEIKGRLRDEVADSDDFDLTDANKFKPSAMAVSFQCRVADGGSLTIRVTGAHYDKLAVSTDGVTKPFDWWVRRPFTLAGSIPGSLLRKSDQLMDWRTTASGQEPRIAPRVRFLSRPVPGSEDPDLRLVTVAVVNDLSDVGPANAFFQMGFSVDAQEGLLIEPYPEVELPDRDDEEQSIDLLYRNKLTYAIGHGCAADWSDEAGTGDALMRVEAIALPAYEVVSLTPNVYVTDEQGHFLLDDQGRRQAVTVSMLELAQGTDEGKRQIETVLRLYEGWIAARRAEIDDLPERLRPAATRHMGLASAALDRMRHGWDLVERDSTAGTAFRWANEAMLYQQVRSNFPLREAVRGKDGVLRVKGSHPEPSVPEGRGMWRPFQIAFILATLPELVNPTSKSRELVDLIFFPTGGGKTEAYLGACAVSLLARRLRDPEDSGTDTLMRYTLRLLTAQQFLRAASLVCVLEDIRDRNSEMLGTAPFGIGIWLGGTSTPNTWKSAVEALKRLRKSPHEQNLFLLLRCPWCGAQMGPKPRGRGGQDVLGYEQIGPRVVLRCVDSQCHYSRRVGLPVHVVDEDIYEVRPSIVIGTVDKFAMMAWRPDARSLFGLAGSGEREVSPPNLIIQDELHLISGPLGSMVGLYEPVIDELCTDRRGEVPVPPKIIASTATIRRFEDQIRGLFGRDQVVLFPPHGLEEGHSFFAEPARLPNGDLEPGRRYVGVMSASLGSTQTVQARVAAATLQAATKIPEEDRDGYWTNLNFLNSLRELGNTVSLLQSDVPDYLAGLMRRDGIEPRWPSRMMELTSRRRSDEIPKAIEQLQVRYGPGLERQEAVDICLASNIIEVGVDIDRLGLMTVVGQPKTTAQYIQVSGRVGRRADVSPGMVITIYGAAKPRDRSHYERFRSYHQQLYAQVEPTSVTPFATPVLRRALHAVAVSYIRQSSARGLPPYPFPSGKFEEAIDLLRQRALKADADELPELDKVAARRAREWEGWERTEWEANPAPWGDPKQGLMRFAGILPEPDVKAPIWDVPTSMRNVDAECRLAISLAYTLADTTTEEGL